MNAGTVTSLGMREVFRTPCDLSIASCGELLEEWAKRFPSVPPMRLIVGPADEAEARRVVLVVRVELSPEHSRMLGLLVDPLLDEDGWRLEA